METRTVQPILDKIYFLKIFNLFDIQTYQEDSKGKFQIYKQNTNLIINLSSQLIQCSVMQQIKSQSSKLYFLFGYLNYQKLDCTLKYFVRSILITCQHYNYFLTPLLFLSLAELFIKFVQIQLNQKKFQLIRDCTKSYSKQLGCYIQNPTVYQKYLIEKFLRFYPDFNFNHNCYWILCSCTQFSQLLYQYQMSINQRIDILSFLRQVLFLQSIFKTRKYYNQNYFSQQVQSKLNQSITIMISQKNLIIDYIRNISIHFYAYFIPIYFRLQQFFQEKKRLFLAGSMQQFYLQAYKSNQQRFDKEEQIF
ncbi:unnamed protein product [Paramecium octaurelia]|uniref:Uncharacterized protein n=1 Tax=Paramecium octaurelia TaxID=43137 RepID=A0A8S1WBQ5_PAROT|nr:unnamed protein product [Paramecium octaurelia]